MKDDLLDFLMNCDNPKMFCEKTFAKNFTDEYAVITGLAFPDCFSFQQKLYHYLNDDMGFKKGICPVCGNRCRLISFKKGYQSFCSKHCSSVYNAERVSAAMKSKSEEERNEIIRKRVDGYHKNDKSKMLEKRRNTCAERYGDETYNNRSSYRSTMNGKTDDERNLIKRKKKDTWERKSCDEMKQITSAAQKNRVKTINEKYGVDNIMLTDFAKENLKSTLSCRTQDELDNRKEKIRAAYSEKMMSKHDDFISYSDGIALCKCSNPNCDRCAERTFETPIKIYNSRKKLGCELCTKIHPIDNNLKLLSKHDDFISYSDGIALCKCSNPNCDRCAERTFETPITIYRDRKRMGCEVCTKLNPIGSQTSGFEKQVLEYVKSVFDGNVVENDRSVLDGKELDIYIPERSLAIELNGVYWHSELYKDKHYHFDKSIGCSEQGIQLLHIWEDTWRLKNDMVKNLIRGKLGLQEKKVNARDCVVRDIDAKTARSFCEMYHIQGYVNSAIHIGLYKDDELLMVALFGQGRRISGAGKKEGEWELYRLCSPFDVLVRGGASKLVRHFIRTNKPNALVTFADLSVSNGNLYETIGFEKDYVVEPTYYWVVDNVRLPRYRFQKGNLKECLENPNLTEVDAMYARGCYRCWDSGKIKYKYIMNTI